MACPKVAGPSLAWFSGNRLFYERRFLIWGLYSLFLAVYMAYTYHE
jgi:hypothetical protein